MASNKVAFFLVLCLCVLSIAECGRQPPISRENNYKCPDPNDVDREESCFDYCRSEGYSGGSCEGHMCKCYVETNISLI
ncbi:unnamed protein product [Arabidopsis halleri]